MAKFYVTYTYYAWATKEVEADSLDDLQEKLEDGDIEMPEASICAQCGGWGREGESLSIGDCPIEEEVLDEDWNTLSKVKL